MSGPRSVRGGTGGLSARASRGDAPGARLGRRRRYGPLHNARADKPPVPPSRIRVLDHRFWRKKRIPTGAPRQDPQASATTYFPAVQYHRRQELNYCVRDGNRCHLSPMVTDKSGRRFSPTAGVFVVIQTSATGRSTRKTWPLTGPVCPMKAESFPRPGPGRRDQVINR